MRNTNKKGFTIVELVIVVAVIAILAAVLIPTFAGIIRQANISSDTVVAKNLNTAAISAGAKDFDEAIVAVKEAGYILANLNAKANGCYFVWDDANKQFLLVDSTDDYKVIYSNNGASEKANWFVAVNDPNAIASIEAAGCQVKKIATSFDDLKTNVAAGGEVYVDESVVLTSSNRILIDDGANVTLKFAGSSVTTSAGMNGIPVEIKKGTVTIEDATVDGAGAFENIHGPNQTAVGFDDGCDLTLENCTINGTTNAVSGANYGYGPVKVTLKNCTLTSKDVGFQLGAYGTGTLNGTNIEAPIPFHVGYGGHVIINSGTYKATTGKMFDMYDYTTNTLNNLPADVKANIDVEKFKTKVTINEGDFTFDNFVQFASNGTNMEIVINGGTFNGKSHLEFFAEYTGANVTISGETVTITKK